MQVDVETYQEVEIKMSGKEASWLKGYMQNTLTDLESSEDVRYRKELFNSLVDAGVK